MWDVDAAHVLVDVAVAQAPQQLLRRQHAGGLQAGRAADRTDAQAKQRSSSPQLEGRCGGLPAVRWPSASNHAARAVPPQLYLQYHHGNDYIAGRALYVSDDSVIEQGKALGLPQRRCRQASRCKLWTGRQNARCSPGWSRRAGWLPPRTHAPCLSKPARRTPVPCLSKPARRPALPTHLGCPARQQPAAVHQ
jgi:hypothetical protein